MQFDKGSVVVNTHSREYKEKVHCRSILYFYSSDFFFFFFDDDSPSVLIALAAFSAFFASFRALRSASACVSTPS
jgi:hypothetical protein